jgi:hypothetical protein
MDSAWIVGTTVLHVAVAAAWFGHKLLIPADLRSSVAAGPETARRLVPRLERSERFGIATGLGTLATGLGLVFLRGPAFVRTPIWVGLGLVLAATAMGAIVARPASNRLRRAIGAGDTTAAMTEAGTLSTVLGAESLLWVGALVTMFL